MILENILRTEFGCISALQRRFKNYDSNLSGLNDQIWNFVENLEGYEYNSGNSSEEEQIEQDLAQIKADLGIVD